MSPEYCDNSKVSKVLIREIKDNIERFGIDYQNAVQVGYAVCRPNGHITHISLLKNVPESIIKDGRKEKSHWHIIHGFAGEYKGKHIPIGHEGEKTPGHTKQYPGKHRSHTKRTGIKALDRRPHKL